MGLPSDRFLFAGFAPTTRAARLKWLEELLPTPATLVSVPPSIIPRPPEDGAAALGARSRK